MNREQELFPILLSSTIVLYIEARVDTPSLRVHNTPIPLLRDSRSDQSYGRTSSFQILTWTVPSKTPSVSLGSGPSPLPSPVLQSPPS